ncbi:hypothetical protein HMPREF1303_00577 [Propionibacterium sp. KPL2009]|nr:hypothetical protein HMPREF1303_00577 [Propionibacterium sp. KPL2009]
MNNKSTDEPLVVAIDSSTHSPKAGRTTWSV